MSVGTYIYEENVTLETMTCGECGITFAAPDYFWVDRKRHKGKSWYCPNGHGRHFSRESVEQRAERLSAELTREQARHDQTRASLRATKGVVTRTKRRIAHGVCPCCKRTFADVARHMAGQHPDYAKEKSP